MYRRLATRTHPLLRRQFSAAHGTVTQWKDTGGSPGAASPSLNLQGYSVMVTDGDYNWRGYEMPINFLICTVITVATLAFMKKVSRKNDPALVRRMALPKCGDYYLKPEWRKNMS